MFCKYVLLYCYDFMYICEDDILMYTSMCNKMFILFLILLISYSYLGQIWGNLISSLVFHKPDEGNITSERLLTCGANFCPSSDENNTNLDKPDMTLVMLNDSQIKSINRHLNDLGIQLIMLITHSNITNYLL